MDKPIGITHQIAFAIGMLGLSWVGMMAVHELGHVLGAWITGGTVQRVVVPVFGFSRTDVQPNSSPGVTVWAGPAVGVLLPILMWFVAARLPWSSFEKPLRFFAGFCLVVNGAYLSLGTFDRIGDVGVMLDTGTPIWVLWAFGACTIPVGFAIWHGLGERFGLPTIKTRWIAWCILSAAIIVCFLDIEIVLAG